MFAGGGAMGGGGITSPLNDGGPAYVFRSKSVSPSSKPYVFCSGSENAGRAGVLIGVKPPPGLFFLVVLPPSFPDGCLPLVPAAYFAEEGS